MLLLTLTKKQSVGQNLLFLVTFINNFPYTFIYFNIISDVSVYNHLLYFISYTYNMYVLLFEKMKFVQY